MPSATAWLNGAWAAGAETLAAALPPERRYLLGAESGADQLIAAAAAAVGHAGTDPLLAALVAGPPDDRSLDEALDVAVAAALATWVEAGMPGRRPDAATARRAGTERALWQCWLIEEERRAAATEAELAARLAAAEAELAVTTGSASWRLTRPLRAAAQALRGRGGNSG